MIQAGLQWLLLFFQGGINGKPGEDHRQLYLFFHHAGVYIYFCIPRHGFIESFLSDTPFFFCFVLFFFAVALDFYSSAAANPGFVEASPTATENLFYCQQCQLHCPVRAGHCPICRRCVRRRDHHCAWTGTCIGRDNHLYYLTYLSIEAFIFVIVISDLVMSMLTPYPIWEWLFYNIPAMLLVGPLTFAVAFCALLTSATVMCAIYNKSTWEIHRRAHISYLMNLPLTLDPFDRGCLANCWEFLTMSADEKEWEYPKPTLKDFVTESVAMRQFMKEEGIA
jgi:hypothetical protein